MIVFWVLAAGLAGLALLFIVPPILRGKSEAAADRIDENQINLAVFRQQLEELDGDLAAGNLVQDQYAASRRDLERELLIDIDDSGPEPAAQKSGKWAALALAPAVPVLAVALYLMVGDHNAIERLDADPATAAQQQTAPADMPSMDVLVARLAERMQREPDNLEGWVMLGRSYLAIGRPRQAVQAYERARQLAPDEPDVLLGYAEALTKAEGGLQGKAEKLIAAALEIDPGNPNGLWMMGLVEFQRDNYTEALGLWTKLETQLTPGGEDVSALRGYMAEARRQASLPQTEPAPTAAQTRPESAEHPASSAGKAIRVQVSLADDLRGTFSPDDTLFVFARALNGPPMPLAVKRLQAKDLPVSLTLDDSMAMMPQMRLSNFDQVLVGARISKSGNANPQGGDLHGEIQPVTPGQEQTVAIVIDGIRP